MTPRTPAEAPRLSIIVPVYNREAEVADLLESLKAQTDRDFETVIVEDGSTLPCRRVVKEYSPCLDIKYFYKDNEGRSIALNYGIDRADGNYLIFVDSDCILPPGYIATLRKCLKEHYTDCFGGPDSAHASFTDIQKAINYSMTSFLTTGGIRGGKILDQSVPSRLRLPQASCGPAQILAAGTCVRHEPHHTETALPRLHEAGTYPSGSVYSRFLCPCPALRLMALVVHPPIGRLPAGCVDSRHHQHQESENRLIRNNDLTHSASRLRHRLYPCIRLENTVAPRPRRGAGDRDATRQVTP